MKPVPMNQQIFEGLLRAQQNKRKNIAFPVMKPKKCLKSVFCALNFCWTGNSLKSKQKGVQRQLWMKDTQEIISGMLKWKVSEMFPKHSEGQIWANAWKIKNRLSVRGCETQETFRRKKYKMAGEIIFFVQKMDGLFNF